MSEPARSWERIELRHLSALRAIARTGSFRAAAMVLGYSQSAISGQLASLETLVGHQLVTRPGGRRRVGLTAAGELLVQHAVQVESTVHAARFDLDALASGPRRLRLGVFQSVAVNLLPGILPRLAAAPQPIVPEIVERPDDEALMRLVERGEIDVSFVVLPLTRGPFEHRELLEDPYRLIVAADSPLAGCASVANAELRDWPVIDYRDVRTVHHLVPKLRPHQRPSVVARSDDNTTIQALVAAGVGIAVLPQLSINSNDPGIRSLPLEPPLPPRRIALAWHRERHLHHFDAALSAIAETVAARPSFR